jgi:hypothetical protein
MNRIENGAWKIGGFLPGIATICSLQNASITSTSPAKVLVNKIHFLKKEIIKLSNFQSNSFPRQLSLILFQILRLPIPFGHLKTRQTLKNWLKRLGRFSQWSPPSVEWIISFPPTAHPSNELIKETAFKTNYRSRFLDLPD